MKFTSVNFHKVALTACLSFIVWASPALAAGVQIPFTVNLSEAVNVDTSGGTPRIPVDVAGTTRYASYSSGSGGSALTFTYDATAGDLDLDGVALSSPIQLNGGTIKDLSGNDAALAFAVPNTAGIKVNYPSLGMNFIADADGRYTLNGTAYNDLTSFLTATGGSFTRASVGTYFDSAGVLQTAASGAPRFDYDPTTHAPKGILIEESRTNLITNSENIAGGGWGGQWTTVTANAILSPSGTMTADLLARSSTTQSCWKSYTYAGSTGSYTLSAFVKAATTGNQFALRIHGNYPDRGDAKFDLLAGTVLGVNAFANYTNASAKIISVGNGWYRVSLKVTANVSNVGIVVFGPTDSSLSLAAWEASSAVLSDAYVWGVQLEQAPFPTSYIPTTAAAVTRAADVLTMPTGSWFDGTKGTMTTVGDVSYLGGVFYPGFSSIDDGTANNAIHFVIADSSSDQKYFEIFNGGVQQSSVTPSNYTAGSSTKFAAGWISNDSRFAADNSLTAQDTSVSLPSVSILRIGARRGGASPLNGHVSSFKYYPARVPDTQLQLLTQ